MKHGLRYMQNSILEETTSLQCQIYNTFDGERIDFENLDEIEQRLGFLYHRVRELNGQE